MEDITITVTHRGLKHEIVLDDGVTKEGFAIESYYEIIGNKIEERYEYIPLN